MLPFDSALPGLNPALDGEKVLRALQARFPKFLPGIDAATCRVSRFRQQPGARAIILYEAASLNHKNRRSALFTGYIFKGSKGCRIYRDARTADRAASRSCTAFLSDLNMLVEAFPLDRKLPRLSDFVNNYDQSVAQFPDQLRRSLAGLSPSVVRYRPGLNATLRLSPKPSSSSADDGRLDTHYAKFHAKDDVVTLVERQRRVLAALTRERNGLHFNQPVAFLQRERATLFRRAKGCSLKALLAGEAAIEPPARKIARALAALHLADTGSLLDKSTQRFEIKLARAEKLIAWACPDAAQSARNVTETVCQAEPPTELRPVHNDMKPEHVFLSARGTEFIDTESVALGDPAYDVGSFLGRLEAAAIVDRIEPARTNVAARAFLDEYLQNVPAAWSTRIPLGLAVGRMLVALHLLQRLWPGWRTKVPELVRFTEHELARRRSGCDDLDNLAGTELGDPKWMGCHA